MEQLLAERRERQREERREEERLARARSEAAYEAAQTRRLEQERAIIEARARWDEARAAEEEAAIALGMVPAPGDASWPPRTGRARYFPVCGWPGVRESRKCPRVSQHPPKPEGYPRA